VVLILIFFFEEDIFIMWWMLIKGHLNRSVCNIIFLDGKSCSNK